MAFELLTKGAQGNNALSLGELSVSKTGIVFPRLLSQEFRSKGYLEVHVDYEGRKVGFKLTADRTTGWSITKNGTLALPSANIAGRIPAGKYKYVYEDGMYVITVKEEMRK